MGLSIKLILIFIIIYIYMLLGIYIFYNIYHYNIFIQINRINFFDKIIIILVFISLGGIPPILGFLRKLLILKIIINYFFFFSSAISLYISYIFFFNFGTINKIKIKL